MSDKQSSNFMKKIVLPSQTPNLMSTDSFKNIENYEHDSDDSETVEENEAVRKL